MTAEAGQVGEGGCVSFVVCMHLFTTIRECKNKFTAKYIYLVVKGELLVLFHLTIAIKKKKNNFSMYQKLLVWLGFARKQQFHTL